MFNISSLKLSKNIKLNLNKKIIFLETQFQTLFSKQNLNILDR
jgi:hypothetical protein